MSPGYAGRDNVKSSLVKMPKISDSIIKSLRLYSGDTPFYLLIGSTCSRKPLRSMSVGEISVQTLMMEICDHRERGRIVENHVRKGEALRCPSTSFDQHLCADLEFLIIL